MAVNDVQSVWGGGCVMNKKERIIDAAIDVFIEKGTEKATIADIVQDAGIAQGTFYLYFPTKLAVMPEIAKVLVEKLLTRFEAEVTADSIDKQLEQVIHIVFNHTDTYKELTKLVYTGLTQSAYLGDWELIYDPLYNWLENVLQKANTKADLVPKYAARILIGMIESAAEQIYLFDSGNEKPVTTHQQQLYNMVCNALGIAS